MGIKNELSSGGHLYGAITQIQYVKDVRVLSGILKITKRDTDYASSQVEIATLEGEKDGLLTQISAGGITEEETKTLKKQLAVVSNRLLNLSHTYEQGISETRVEVRKDELVSLRNNYSFNDFKVLYHKAKENPLYTGWEDC